MEVLATIRFTTPCLGNVRGRELDEMLRDTHGQVIFLQTWWRSGLGYAAQALCRYQKDVTKVQTDPAVKGELSTYRRYYAPDAYKLHEAFDAGSVLQARFMLPRRMSLEGFRGLLETAGRYVGISPYGYRQDFGRFVVENVEIVRARKCKRNDGKAQGPDKAGRVSHSSDPGPPPDPVRRADV